MTVQSTGRRTFFHQRGANAWLRPEHFDFTGTRARFFHLGYLLLLDGLDALGHDGRPGSTTVLARARAAGLITSVDCVSEAGSRFRSHVVPALSEVDLLFANDFETEQLTGVTVGRGSGLDRRAVERAARALLELGVRSLVLVHSPEGVCACCATGETVWQSAVRVPPEQVAGTTGAGDALAAGVLYGLHQDWPLKRALELGVCAAAVSLGSPTCSDALVPADECLAFGRRHGFGAPPA